MKKARTIQEYITQFPAPVQAMLVRMRAIIQSVAPHAEEGISYGMPAFKLNGKPLAYFAGYAHHIGFYPTSSPISVFTKELAQYTHSKGAVQFPLNTQLPVTLIKKMVRFRAQEIQKAINLKTGSR